jgi:NAD dependent epimerase/dehydratase
VRSALVTGAGGFIASHLVEELVAGGVAVRALVRYNGRSDLGMLADLEPEIRNEVEIVFGDVTDPHDMRARSRGVEAVFHLAALIGIPHSYVAPASYVETNVLGTLNLLEAARDAGVERFIQTSTSEVYGTAQYVPIDEDHPLHPQSPYAATKVGADELALSYHRSFDLPVAVVRPFNTFGPRQSARAVIPTVISQLLGGGALRLGSTETRRDFTFVKDTARGFRMVAEAGSAAVGRVINLGTGVDHTIGEVAQAAADLIGVELDVERDESRVRPAASEVERLQAAAGLARELTGWEPLEDLQGGLAHTIEWVRSNLGRFDVARYAV